MRAGAIHSRLPPRKYRDRSRRSPAFSANASWRARCCKIPRTGPPSSTRRRANETEALAVELGAGFRAAAYHAGLDSKRRTQVQDEFSRRQDRSHGRHHRVRDGNRQTRREDGYPHRAARQRSKAITRRSAAPDATELRAARSSCSPMPIATRTTSFFERDYPDISVLDRSIAH